MKNQNKKIFIPILLCLLFVLGGAAAFFLLRNRPNPDNPQTDDGQMEADLERLSGETYEGVLLSMHDPEKFTEEDFSHFCGQNILVTSHTILDTEELSLYLDCILDSGNQVSHIYLCPDPELLWQGAGEKADKWSSSLSEGLYSYMESHPEISFDVLLPYPQMEYWMHLQEKELDTLLTVYRTFVNEISAFPNTRAYFPGIAYWLMVNPDNYEDSLFDGNRSVTQKLLQYTFCDRIFQISPANEEEFWQSLRETIAREKDTPADYPDLSDYYFVFFGDSVLGNFTGSLSIPGYVTGLSGAAAYNFAVGGGSATYHGENDCDFPNVIQRFLKENLSDTAGGKVFAPGGNTIDGLENKKMCIVINFGLNDYFTGSLIENPADPDDTASYKGGLRACIARLRENFPHAAYIVMSPTHTGFFSNGRDIQSPQGGPLSAYVDAAEAAALETGAYFLDNYNDFVITDENLWDYLGDGCHPNENGHLAIAAHIMDFVRKEVPGQ